MEFVGAEFISKNINEESYVHNIETKSYFQSDVVNPIEKDSQLLNNSSSYVKQEEFNIQSIGGIKTFASSLSDAQVVTKCKKPSFKATNTKHDQLPQRKLPLGAIPGYIKNFGKRSVCIESNTSVKLRNTSASTFQDSMIKVNKFNLKTETSSNILVGDETRASQDKLLSVDSANKAVRDLLFKSNEGDQIPYNDSDVTKLSDEMNHIFEKKAILLENKIHSDMPTEPKNKNPYTQIYQPKTYLKKYKSEEIRVLEKKLQSCRKKNKANKAQKVTIANESFLEIDTNLSKEKVEIDKKVIQFDYLMKIIEKLKIELNSYCPAIELVMQIFFVLVQRDLRNMEQEKSYLDELDEVRAELEVMCKKYDFLNGNSKSLIDENNMSEIIKSNPERNEFEVLQATLAQLSQKNTILKSNLEYEKHKNATQMDLLELRGEIIKNMQDNEDYHKIRIISLLKDIEIEQKKTKEFVKMQAAHQEELNNIFSTMKRTQRCNTQLEAELDELTFGKQPELKNI